MTETLERLEARQTSKGRTLELAEVLQERLEADSGFPPVNGHQDFRDP